MQAVNETDDTIRSGCPVSLGLDVFGDKWTLLVVRDLMFGGKRYFREIQSSAEGISSNILADRLRLLVNEGVITRADDPDHKQKVRYSLTEKGIALLPVLMQISRWSYQYRSVGETYLAGAAQGDPERWDELMAGVRRAHLGTGD